MPDDLTAALEAIQAEADGSIAYSGDHDCPDFWTSCAAHHTLRLLAALRAVLELHRPVGEGCAAGGCTWSWPCPTYRAVSSSLAGKEKNDAPH